MQLPILIRKGGFAHLRKTASFKAFKPMEQAVYTSVQTSRKPVFDLACRFYRHAKGIAEQSAMPFCFLKHMENVHDFPHFQY